jgi:hypothetical protein
MISASRGTYSAGDQLPRADARQAPCARCSADISGCYNPSPLDRANDQSTSPPDMAMPETWRNHPPSLSITHNFCADHGAQFYIGEARQSAHMTILPGGGSLARARYPPSLATFVK